MACRRYSWLQNALIKECWRCASLAPPGPWEHHQKPRDLSRPLPRSLLHVLQRKLRRAMLSLGLAQVRRLLSHEAAVKQLRLKWTHSWGSALQHRDGNICAPYCDEARDRPEPGRTKEAVGYCYPTITNRR